MSMNNKLFEKKTSSVYIIMFSPHIMSRQHQWTSFIGVLKARLLNTLHRKRESDRFIYNSFYFARISTNIEI